MKRLILVLAVFLFSALNAFATQLPVQVKEFILKEYPKTSIRFDGLVTLNDGTMYLPVIPAYLDKVEKLQIAFTYPDKMSLKQKPEIVIFNNNYALLKIITTKNGIVTVSQTQNVPITIKTGSLPQDILVPKGLVLPDTMKGILGDVKIPLLNSGVVGKVVSPSAQSKPAPLPNKRNDAKLKVAINDKLKNKIYFVNNYDSQYLKVFSSDMPEPLYSLKLSGVLKDMQPCQDKFLLILANNKKQVDVVDVKHEYIAKQIDLGILPSEIVIDNINNKAYVACTNDETIFVIDLKTMAIKEKIEVIGAPKNLAVSEDGSQLAYVDRSSSNIYIMKLDNEYENKLVANESNVSKLLIYNSSLYIIDRVKNTFKTVSYDLEKTFDDDSESVKNEKKSVKENILSGFVDVERNKKKDLTDKPNYYSVDEKTFEIGEKPTDMLLYKNKLFILSAKDNEINVFDINAQTMKKTIKLPLAGFSKRISMVPGTNLAIVTNVLDKRYAVIDLDKLASIQAVNINYPVNAVTIIDKNKL